jgi:EAL domain-containing protein (putative c-di-GMP-specific phosphodiesterase class I)
MSPKATAAEASGATEDLRHALEEGHFILYAQSLLALQGPTRFPMVEIFVRMQHEERALLPPGDFFPIFEECGMMPALDRWVVRETMHQTRARAAFRSFCINISRQTIEDRTFPRDLAKEIRLAGVVPQRITFEITERDAAASTKAAQDFGWAVRDIGCQLIIEDFLCEQRSFDLLRIVRPNYVKIDGGIVRSLTSSTAGRMKLKAAGAAASAIRAKLMVESVEDTETLDVVRTLDVDFAQGFAIQRPVPIENI